MVIHSPLTIMFESIASFLGIICCHPQIIEAIYLCSAAVRWQVLEEITVDLARLSLDFKTIRLPSVVWCESRVLKSSE